MGRRITRDYKSEMSELLSDPKRTYHEKVPEEGRTRVDISRNTLRQMTRRHGLHRIILRLKDEKIMKINRVYFVDEKDLFDVHENQFKLDQRYLRFTPFYMFSNNFFNFSVSGSAFGMKLRLKKSKELEDIEKNSPEDYDTILKNVKTPFDEEEKEDMEILDEIKSTEASKQNMKKVN